jgi:glycosyltransferase involved in cell wall biosynthesis
MGRERNRRVGIVAKLLGEPGMEWKLAVKIPAYNEQDYIVDAINDIPRHIDGVSSVEVIVVDDGSADNTAELARDAGADHVVSHGKNRGLGVAHRTGLAHALEIGADVIVNYDADIQYRGDEIHKIIQPILHGEANAVIGDRRLLGIKGYAAYKHFTKRLGRVLVALLFFRDVRDTASGFRAYDREAATLLVKSLRNDYTYTLEEICMLAKKGMRIAVVPTEIRFPTRKSRLITDRGQYAKDWISVLIRCRFRRD